VNNADWWSKRLGNQQPVAQPRQINIPMPPSQQPMTPMPTFQQPQTSKAQSANQTATCPDCGSSNYMSPSPTIALRCYDCGYPVQQSGSRFGNLAGAHVEGSAKASLGNDSQSNWNPQGIIGRIDG
jgi:ribosomal protein S27E